MYSKLLPAIPLHTKNEFILGKHRAQWVVHATKALIGSTDLHLRWLLLKAGEDEFFRVARPLFKNHPPSIDFTNDEMRWMGQALWATLPPRFKAAMQASEISHLQRKVITDAMLRSQDGDDPLGIGPSSHSDGITVETLPDGEKAPMVH